MSYKFLRNGTSGCAKESNCKYTHPKMCRASLATGNCMRRNCQYYHKSGTNMKTENKLNPFHRESCCNRATPLMDLNLPTHNYPQTTTASIKPLTQHLAASQHLPSYIVYSYQAPTDPQLLSGRPIPQQSNNPTSTQSSAVFSTNECAKAANDRNAPITKLTDYDYEPCIATDNPPIKTVVILLQFHLLKCFLSHYKDTIEV